MSRAQTATEYLIILAIVLIVGVLLVTLLFDFSLPISKTNSMTSDIVFAQGNLIVEDLAIRENRATLSLVNNLEVPVSVVNITVGGQICQVCDTNSFAMKESVTISCSDLDSEDSAGDSFAYDVLATYKDGQTGAIYTESYNGKALRGEVSLSDFTSATMTFVWNTSYHYDLSAWGGENLEFDYGHGGAVDLCGNVLLAGFQDSYKYSPQSTQWYFEKRATNGNVLWQKTWGGTDEDEAYGLAVDFHGNSYIVGFETDSPGMPDYGGGGAKDAVLLKVDSSGNVIWNTSWGGSGNDYADDVVLDSQGNIYTVGYEAGAPGVPDYGGGGNNDSVVLKFDRDGNYVWNFTWGGSGSDQGNDIILDSQDNVYFVGHETSAPGVNDYGGGGGIDLFVVKIDSDGNYIWNFTWGGPETDNANGVILFEGYLYVTGTERNAPGMNDYGGGNANDILLLKLDTDGNYVWNSSWGGSNNENGKAIVVDSQNNMYIGGSEYISTGMDTYGGGGGTDFLLLKFDTSGNYVQNFSWGLASSDAAQDLAMDTQGHIFLIGHGEDIYNGTSESDAITLKIS